MQSNSKDMIVFLVLAVAVYSTLLLSGDRNVIDIQLHDTYYVIDRLSMTVAITAPMALLIFAIRAMLKKFKGIGSNVALIVALGLTAFVVVQIASMIEAANGVPAGNNFIWIIFTILISMALGLLFHTIRLVGRRQPKTQ